MTFTKFTTTQGIRWDTIAYQMYGDAAAYPRLIEANPDVPATPRLPGGIQLRIPIIDLPQEVAPQDTLPPWLR